jgi:A/G-specific adenine glycosylase
MMNNPHSVAADFWFANQLVTWYKTNHRELPWRDIQNPYFIWLSEIILQQTRVKQGLPYYQAFTEKYPTVEDLANATESEVLRLWQGLGYYSRARNMHATAQYIVAKLAGKFPNNYKDLLSLKGVGKYTAAAIASFAYHEAVAVVDGNVYRVLARFLGISTDIASSQGAKEFGELAQILLPPNDSATHNQAIMELGATQCTPKKPNCLFCPVNSRCVAFAKGLQDDLPVKNLKINTKERYFHYLIFRQEDKILLKERTPKDIWQGLYDFALIEDTKWLGWEAIAEKAELSKILPKFALETESVPFKHSLTHQIIYAKFWHIHLQSDVIYQFPLATLSAYTLGETQALPKPILIANYLTKHFF